MFVIEEGSEAMRYLRTAMAHVPSKVSFEERANGVAIKVGEGMWTTALDTESPFTKQQRQRDSEREADIALGFDGSARMIQQRLAGESS